MIIEINFKSGHTSFLSVVSAEKEEDEIAYVVNDDSRHFRLEKLKDIKSVHLFFNGTVRVLHQEKCDD